MKFNVGLFLLVVSSVSSFQVLPALTNQQRMMSRSTTASFMVAGTDKPSLKRLPDSAVEISIPVPGTATQAAYDKVCTELSKTVQIPGFRKGSRIPPQVLEQTMAAKGGKNALKTQAINELLSKLVEPALKEQALEPIGQPALVQAVEDLAAEFKPGQELTLMVKCDVWPEIQWKTVEGQEKPYTGLTGKYQRKPFNEVKLNQALKDLKERYATLEPITDALHALKTGDACVVNMEGYLADADGNKGEPLPNAASGDRVEVILGPGRYMAGLVEGLEGATVGQTITVKVNFPDVSLVQQTATLEENMGTVGMARTHTPSFSFSQQKLRDKTLAGKQAIFDVEVLEASKRSVPEITDEFAEQVRAGLTADALMAELKKAIDEEDSKEFVGARNKVLGDALSQVMDVQVPDTLVTNQAREKFAVMMSEMRDSGVADEEIKKQISPENFLKYKAIVKADISRDFKVSMATDEIARMEGIQVPDYQVEEQMESIRKDAGERSEEFDETMVRGKVETTLARQAVMDWLAEQSKLDVEFTDETFDETLMESLAEESLEREKKLAEERAASEQGKATTTTEDEVVPEAVATIAPPVNLIDAEEEPTMEEQVAEVPHQLKKKTRRLEQLDTPNCLWKNEPFKSCSIQEPFNPTLTPTTRTTTIRKTTDTSNTLCFAFPLNAV